MDLKALISDIYDGASISTLFTGTRFNGGSNTPDEYGRHSSAAYRDLNPAFFHITAANLLGKLNATSLLMSLPVRRCGTSQCVASRCTSRLRCRLRRLPRPSTVLRRTRGTPLQEHRVRQVASLVDLRDVHGRWSSVIWPGGPIHDGCLLHVPA
ncbi:Transglutaminase elicitor [Phytophthora cactorum]|nr:Transglutaminase elicitor [Phytophthora cactorum]